MARERVCGWTVALGCCFPSSFLAFVRAERQYILCLDDKVAGLLCLAAAFLLLSWPLLILIEQHTHWLFLALSFLPPPSPSFSPLVCTHIDTNDQDSNHGTGLRCERSQMFKNVHAEPTCCSQCAEPKMHHSNSSFDGEGPARAHAG